MSSVSTTGLGYSVAPAQRDGAWYWEAQNVAHKIFGEDCAACTNKCDFGH